MENIRALTSEELVSNTQNLVAQERRVGLEVLNHLREIDARKLYLERGFPSLFEMCVKEFGYSAGAAQRRIEAMRLTRDVPEVKCKIESGAVSLSTAASIQSFLRHERKLERPYSRTEKLELIAACENKSTREVEREIASRNPTFSRREIVRENGDGTSRISISVSEELRSSLDRLVELMSHKTARVASIGKYEAVLAVLIEQEIKRRDPLRKIRNERDKFKPLRSSIEIEPESTSESKSELTPVNRLKDLPEMTAGHAPEYAKPLQHHFGRRLMDFADPNEGRSAAESNSFPAPETATRIRNIPASVRRIVGARNRDGGCEFVSPLTGRRCGSRHFNQIDHMLPFSMGGEHEPANLRVLCGQHNRFAFKRLVPK